MIFSDVLSFSECLYKKGKASHSQHHSLTALRYIISQESANFMDIQIILMEQVAYVSYR